MPANDEYSEFLKTLEGLPQHERNRAISQWQQSKAAGQQPSSESLVPAELSQSYQNVLGYSKAEGVPIGQALEEVADPATVDPNIRRSMVAQSIREQTGMDPAQALIAADEYMGKYRQSRQQPMGEIPSVPGGQAPQGGGIGTWTPPEAAQQMMQAGVQGMGMPQFPVMGAPSTGGISKAMEAQQKAYEKQAAGLKESTGKYQEAIRERAGVEAEAIQQEADLMETRDRALEQLEAQRIEREQDRQAYMEQEVSKVREAVESINESGIDPYRFYRHPDGGVDYVKSVGSAIAIGLGALASNLPAQYGGGGPNVALQIVERAIDRDLQAQRDDLANRRAGVGLQMNLLGQMRARFSDERQAEQATRMVMLETYKNKLQTTAAKSADDKILANADVMSSQIDQKLAEITGEIATKAAASYTQQQTQLFGSELARRQMLQAQREKKFGVEMAQRQAAMKPAGKQLPASAVQKMADFSGAENIISQVERAWVDTMKGSFGAGLSQYAPWATEAKSFSDMTAMAAQFIGKKLEGRMTDEDYDRMKAMLPTPGDSNERAMKKLDALKGFLRAMNDETISTYQKTGYDVTGFQQSTGQGQAPGRFVEQ